MTVYVRPDAGGKYHIGYHSSRTWPGRIVCNCNFVGTPALVQNPRDDMICKLCRRGPTEYIERTFGGIRVKP